MIWVTGATGLLGRAIVKELTRNGIECVVDRIKFDDEAWIKNFLENNDIHLVINCAAYTDVKGAEVNRKEAYDVNVLGVKNLADRCFFRRHSVPYIHFSSNYVYADNNMEDFDVFALLSSKDDLGVRYAPKSFYGLTKLIGDIEISHIDDGNGDCPYYIIYRIANLYGSGRRCVLDSIIEQANRLHKVQFYNSYSNWTYADDLAKHVVSKIISKNGYGINNIANEGFDYVPDFLTEFVVEAKNAGLIPHDTKMKIIEVPEDSLVPRKIIMELDIKLRPNKEAIKDYVEAKVRQKKEGCGG